MNIVRPPAHRVAYATSRASLLVVAVIVCAFLSQARASDFKLFSITLKGSLTTGSQIFLDPNSSDEFRRAQFFSIDKTWGYGVEVRYRFPESDIAVALSADYLRTTQTSFIRLSNRQIPVDDGYRVIPVEMTGYFIIPFSGEVIGVYIGGGGGAYFGRRIYRIGNTEAPSIDQGVGYGIHVLSGVTYRLNAFVQLSAEMKFRDLQFNSVNQFSSPQAEYGSTFVQVSTQPFESRVHTDGMIFQVGIVFEL